MHFIGFLLPPIGNWILFQSLVTSKKDCTTLSVVNSLVQFLMDACFVGSKRLEGNGLCIDQRKTNQVSNDKNVLDILTILPRDEILSKGVFNVRDIIDAECKDVEVVKKWDIFWNNYIKKYWMSSEEFIKTWNICDE